MAEANEQFRKVQEIDTRDYQPSEEDIKEYAVSLGMDVEQDALFMPIAREGIVAQLPQGWKAWLNPMNNIFYENALNQTLTFEHPLDNYYKQKFIQQKYKHFSQVQPPENYYQLEEEPPTRRQALQQQHERRLADYKLHQLPIFTAQQEELFKKKQQENKNKYVQQLVVDKARFQEQHMHSEKLQQLRESLIGEQQQKQKEIRAFNSQFEERVVQEVRENKQAQVRQLTQTLAQLRQKHGSKEDRVEAEVGRQLAEFKEQLNREYQKEEAYLQSQKKARDISNLQDRQNIRLIFQKKEKLLLEQMETQLQHDLLLFQQEYRQVHSARPTQEHNLLQQIKQKKDQLKHILNHNFFTQSKPLHKQEPNKKKPKKNIAEIQNLMTYYLSKTQNKQDSAMKMRYTMDSFHNKSDNSLKVSTELTQQLTKTTSDFKTPQEEKNLVSPGSTDSLLKKGYLCLENQLQLQKQKPIRWDSVVQRETKVQNQIKMAIIQEQHSIFKRQLQINLKLENLQNAAVCTPQEQEAQRVAKAQVQEDIKTLSQNQVQFKDFQKDQKTKKGLLNDLTNHLKQQGDSGEQQAQLKHLYNKYNSFKIYLPTYLQSSQSKFQPADPLPSEPPKALHSRSTDNLLPDKTRRLVDIYRPAIPKNYILKKHHENKKNHYFGSKINATETTGLARMGNRSLEHGLQKTPSEKTASGSKYPPDKTPLSQNIIVKNLKFELNRNVYNSNFYQKSKY